MRTWNFGLGRLWLLLAALLTAGITSAQGPAPPWNVDTTAGDEPITPIPLPQAADPRKLALGARLFDDPKLSHDGTRACSSCHDIRTNGADGHQTDETPDGTRLPFSTPTVFNAALSFRLGWEGNIRTLEEQIAMSLNDPKIMATSVDASLRALKSEKGMTALFESAYGHEPDRDSLLDAIATYERSLLTPGSRFDRWLGGDTGVLSALELSGYQMFKSFGCVSCHQGVNVGGNLFERGGIFHQLIPGQSKVLRVPSLRNVAVTAPYFQNGSVSTLDDAVRKMGHAQLDRTLSDAEVNAIVAFLKTLTGSYQGRMLTAPP